MIRKNYYFAYGSNLNRENMNWRCPKAKFVESYVLENYKLVFRSVADIEDSPGEKVYGGLYKITKDCEKALDRYEGFPHLYDKEYLNKEIDGELVTLMTYSMVDKNSEYPPNEGYFTTIFQGYQDWKLPIEALEKSLLNNNL